MFERGLGLGLRVFLDFFFEDSLIFSKSVYCEKVKKVSSILVNKRGLG